MALFQYRQKMRTRHQKNLKVILSMEQRELANWLANLPDDEIEYVVWLVEEVEIALDNMIIDQHGLDQAEELLNQFTLKSRP